MGWFDWMLRPFRGAPAPEPEPSPTSEGGARPAPAAQRVEPARPRPEAARPRPEPKPRGEKKKKARKKEGGLARPPAVAAPVAEVLSVEEAERRYGEAVKPRPAPAPAAPAAVAAPAEEAPPPIARDPLAEARRAEAANHRRKARVPQFQRLLSHTDALLAVPEVEPRQLQSARRQLVDGWKELGSPPAEDKDALVARRDQVLAALDARLTAAAAVADAKRHEEDARRFAVVDEAKVLAEREDLRGAGPAMGELRTRLRAIGKVPGDHPAMVAFAEAEGRLAARQQQSRADRDTARRDALERLEQLVKRAEVLAASADPEGASERVKALQATWKTIKVPGPRAEVDAVWTRFRTACDAVFAARTAARAEASKAAVERMEAIVARVEGLVETGFDGDADDEIDKVLTTWKRAGRAPREVQQALWERLQRAFDQLRSPPVELGEQDPSSLQFRPFEQLR